MKHIKLFESFLNEEHSNMTDKEVKKILSVFKDEHTKRNIISLLCNDEGSTEDEIMQFLVDDLEIDPDAAAEVYKTAEWFRLDYMDYCLKNGGDEGLYESVNETSKNDWDELKPLDKEGLVDLALELDYSANGPMPVSDVDELRKEYEEKDEADLFDDVAKFLSCSPDEESIIKSLKEIYTHGYILHQNNDFHQWGGEPDEDEEDDD